MHICEYGTKSAITKNLIKLKSFCVSCMMYISHWGNSMPTDTLFCRPIPDFDEIWQAWRSTEETNLYQVSTHFNHF